jgi:peptidyl-prolyl cis-trans isomerase C
MKLRCVSTIWIASLLLISALFLGGCGKENPAPTATGLLSTPSATYTPLPTSTPEPTPTPEPLAALVNDEPLTLAEFQSELARYQASQAATGTNLATDGDAQQIVLDDLVDQMLLAQAARSSGYTVDDAALQARIDALVTQLGGQEALSAWMLEQGYSEADFRQALRRSIEAAWMRDQIINAVPDTAEQVHARQILLYNSDEANQVYALLQSGSDFAELATQYDPLADGDLGWFPRHYLLEPALEEAAYSLEPGQYSPVIETQLGFHILQVIEKDPAHPLEPDARWALQVQALQDWLQAQRSQSTIQILLP